MSPLTSAHGANLSFPSVEKGITAHFPVGAVKDHSLEGKIRRLDDTYRRYLRTYPLGLWAPGLSVTQEMHRLTNLLLSLAEIRRALLCLYRASLRDISPPEIPLLDHAPSWLGVVPYLPRNMRIINPGMLLRVAASHQHLRMQLFFALHLPRRHGESFGRYPAQAGFIRKWLETRRSSGKSLSCLDAACGTGEGTYELAMLIDPFTPCWIVEGISRDPFEILAAAHVFFPHDANRESEYRQAIRPLLAANALSKVRFSVGEIGSSEMGAERFDLILCNGLLGGPLFHEPAAIASATARLCSALKRNGLIVIADRFHSGWRKKLPKTFLKQCLEQAGIMAVDAGEGLGGIKKAAAT